MSIIKRLIKLSFVLLILVSLQSLHAQNDYSSEQTITEFSEIMNIVDPNEIIGTEVLIKNLELSDDELTFQY